jgi:hypothetical protein
MQATMQNDRGKDIDVHLSMAEAVVSLDVTFEESQNGQMGNNGMAQLGVAVSEELIQVNLARFQEDDPAGPPATIVLEFKKTASGWQIQEF